ncbi:E3 ubiquitin-protein ligase RNF31-like [Pseudophryne corroboree]|uniref:E3 ubiquitin-protein ligase RNF31-like n=1 Tax=Pseudophryne corroboree TaxID=495146 RepID=UPI0030815900
MKIDTQGNSCLIFIHRCLLWICCLQRDDDNTSTTNNVSQRGRNDDFHLLEEKQRIFERLCMVSTGCWSMEDIQEAVSSCPDYTSALQYLSHECQICREQFPYSKFVKMTHCNCSFCELCFIHHFSSVIKEKSVINFMCPICKKPELGNEGNAEESMEFFSLLDTQIHHYLDQETYELFQRKLRDRALLKMPNFRWCSHCSFGIVHEVDTLKMDCPACNKSTCFSCKEQWEDAHENLRCEEFRLLKLQHQPQELDTYLLEHGIDCPSCTFRFDLWKGGCLHFKCTQCQYEFCGGCGQPFHQGSGCNFSDECHAKGLNAHHTRDCFYYLRDWDIERLQQLLQESGIKYKSDLNREPPGPLEGTLSSEKKSHDDQTGQKDDNSVNNVDKKEFLVRIIKSNCLDPADLYTEEEMEVELRRWHVTIPENSEDYSKETHLQKMKMILKKEIPLSLYPD